MAKTKPPRNTKGVPRIRANTDAAVVPTVTAAGAADTPAIVYAEASLAIKDVEDAHRHFVAMLARAEPAIVDLSRIQVIDTAGVQLLLALQAEALRRGAPLEFRGASAAFTHALNVLGLQDRFHG
jgi:anti-anti-sigma regulatory factor